MSPGKGLTNALKIRVTNIILIIAIGTFVLTPKVNAQSTFIDSLHQLKKTYSSSEFINVLANLSYEVVTTTNVELEGILNDGVKKAKALKNKGVEAELYHQLSLCYAYQGRQDKRLEYSLKAINLFNKIGNRKKVGNIYTFLGYSMKGRNMPKAKEYMIKGIRILEQENEQFALNGAYDNYGVLQELSGNVDSAIYYYNKALALKKDQVDSLGIPYALGHLASAYSIKKDFTRAKSFLDQAYEIRTKRKDKIGIAESTVQYADFYFAQKKYNEAIPYFLESYDLAKQSNYLYLQEYATDFAAQCYEFKGDFRNALKYQKIQQSLQDSMLNEGTNKSIAALEIQFETEKKEKKLAEQDATIAKQDLKDKKRNYLLISLAGLMLFSIIFGRYFYLQQKFKQQKLLEENRLKDELAKIRLENELHEERTRISKDLHDNIGSQLTFIISSVDNLRYLSQGADEKLKSKLENVSTFSRSTISQLRDTVWALNQDEISFEDLKSRLKEYLQIASNAQQNTSIEMTTDVDSPITFNAIEGVNVYRIVQEALNNALKYAQASKIKIQFSEIDSTLELVVSDDGIGFDVSRANFGNGIENMEKRAKAMHGKFAFRSTPQAGTTITVQIPINTSNDV